MRKIFAIMLISMLTMFALTTGANAAAIAAPDTTDIVGTVVNFGGAAITVWLAYIIYPVAIKVLKSLFN